MADRVTHSDRNRWAFIGTALTVVATVIAGAVTLVSYVHGIQTDAVQQRADWASKSAVMEYRLDRDEQEINRLRDERCEP
jgi:hypothetical protein